MIHCRVQEARPRVDNNVFRSPRVMQQADSRGQRIKQTTMNGSRGIHPSPTSHDGSNQNGIISGQNADQITGKPVSVGANNIQSTSGLSYEYIVTCMLRNAAANLEQEISQNDKKNLQASESSSHMTIGGEKANEVSGNGIANGMKATQATAASPVESLETGLIPDPAMEVQVQEIPAMDSPASDQLLRTNKDTTNSQMDMDDLQLFVNRLNDNEFEMLHNCCTSEGDDRTEATALANEEDIETYLVDKHE